MMRFPDRVTIGEKYKPAMEITDQAEADAYFEDLVDHMMRMGNDRATAESIERQNLGYFAGYYDEGVRAQVERLFRCAHPLFGTIAESGSVSPLAAFHAGVALARKEMG